MDERLASIPMTAVSPAPIRWKLWLKLYWGTVAWLARRGEKSPRIGRLLARTALITGDSLVKLSMIHFARWSLFSHIPANASEKAPTRLQCPYLLFETNFNGQGNQYFEAFSLITPRAMNATWSGCWGVPNVKETGRFIDYINANKEKRFPYHYAGYSGTTKQIRRALELGREIAAFNESLAQHPLSPQEFRTAFDRLLTKVQTIRNPSRPAEGKRTGTLTVMTPVKPGRKKRVKRAMRELRRRGDGLFPDGTHFARFVMIDELRPRPDRSPDPTSYLLFSAWFDGEQGQFSRDLYTSLRGDDLARRVWRHCGFTDSGKPEDFARYLGEYQVEVGTSFSGYDGVTVDEVTDALRLAKRFTTFAAKSHARPPDELQAAWKKKFM
jgi:hypothetical protein